jgi:hypothetical protein
LSWKKRFVGVCVCIISRVPKEKIKIEEADFPPIKYRSVKVIDEDDWKYLVCWWMIGEC